MVRPLGFACAPGLLILPASLASGAGMEALVLAPLAVWRLAAALVAVRCALRVGLLAACAAPAAGVVPALLVAGVVAGTLFRQLDPD